jgi:hypothetical protein
LAGILLMQTDSSNQKPQDIKPEGWVNVPKLSDLKQELTDATPDNESRFTQVEEWLDNLRVKGKAKPKTRKNRSSVQPKLVRKQAEWRYPSLSQPFLSTTDLFNVNPTTYEDVEAAEQNALVLNNQFNTKIDKVRFIGNYVRTGVDEGTIICRVGWKYREKVIKRQVERFNFVPTQDPRIKDLYAQFEQMMAANPASVRSTAENIKQGYFATQQTGQLIAAMPTGEIVEQEEVKVVANHPTVEVCDYNRVYIDPTCGDDFDNAQFVIYRMETTLAELHEEKDKYQNLDKIVLEQVSTLAQPDDAFTESTFQFLDDLRKKITVYEYWGYADINGDGLLEPIVAAWAGDTMIRMEENPFPDGELPFVVVPFLQVARELTGEPDGALLEDNQKIIGAVTRGMLDILGRSANGQQGVRKDALDFVNRRRFERGEDYEFNGNIPDPRAAFYMHTYPEIPASAQFVLQQQGMEAESLTGVKAFSSGISSSSLGDVAAGIRGVLDAASKRESDILQRLADGLVKIGRKFIAMNAEWLSEKEVVRVTNDKFVTVDRDDLAGNYDLRLTISTAEEDDSKAQEMSFMLQTVGPNADPKIVFLIMSKIAKLRKMPDVAKMLEEYEPQPDPLAVEKAQLEIELLKAQIAQIQNGSDATGIKAQLDQAKIGTEHAKAEQLQSQADINTLDFVEQETGVKQERDLQKQGEQARANMVLEEHKARLNPKSTTK